MQHPSHRGPRELTLSGRPRWLSVFPPRLITPTCRSQHCICCGNGKFLYRGIVCGNDRLSLTLYLGYKLLSVEMTNCLWKWHHCLLKWQTVIKHPIMDRFQISICIKYWLYLLHKVRKFASCATTSQAAKNWTKEGYKTVGSQIMDSRPVIVW